MSPLASPSTLAVPGILATPQPDGSVRCGVCAHRCLVRPGRAGICAVRENRDGRLWCTAYGAVAAVGIDPIEKKPLFHVDPGSLAFSIATTGCPFHCTFCQNWELAQGPRLGLDVATTPMPPARVVAEARRAGAGSIAYTYIEPTVFLEYALDTARLARAAGLRNLFITDGYATPEACELLAGVLDAANVDLKSFDDAFYRRQCGARLAHVLEAIDALHGAGVWLELTTLVIPGHNDSDEELRALTSWIVTTLGPGTPWHVSRFHPAFRMRDVPPTPSATLRRAAEIGREAGLLYVYVGNAPELRLEDTRCAGCGRVLVERTGYRCRSSVGPGGACPGCGRRLEGRWPGAMAGSAGRARRGGLDRWGEVTTVRGRGAGGRAAVRASAVSGTFYPDRPDELDDLVAGLFAAAGRLPGATAGAPVDATAEDVAAAGRPLGILVPHAGLTYSGVTAAAAWACLRAGLPQPGAPEPTVVILGTNHWAGWLDGVGAWEAGAWATPARELSVDADLAAEIVALGRPFLVDRDAHGREHSIEVQLPLLASVAPAARIVPLAVAAGTGAIAIAAGMQLGRLLASWLATGTPVVLAISTDMAHYPPADACARATEVLLPAILDPDPEALASAERRLREAGVPGLACGMCGIEPAVLGMAAVLAMGARSGMRLAASTSADAGGPPGRTVGYLAVRFDA